MAFLLGKKAVSFHHADVAINLPTKSGENTSLPDICKSITPPCYLNPLLFNGHLQTLWTVTSNQHIPIYYKRRIFSADRKGFSGTFTVDFVVDENADKDESLPPRTTYYSAAELESQSSLDSRPMLVALHGLSGGSHEVYLRCVLEPLATKEAGFEICVVNSRGCASSKVTSQVLYNARATWDVRQVVNWLRSKYPNRPLFGLGFSLGASILTTYIGEEGSSCALKAAVVCSNPWNLEVGSLALQRTWLGLHVYSRGMASNMKALVNKHLDQVSRVPNINVERLQNVRFLHEFDREIQCPTWGYPTEEDDPIAVNEAIPYQEIRSNPYVVLCATSSGGHLGWFEAGGGRWFVKPAAGFLCKMAKDIDLGKLGAEAQALSNGQSDSVGKYRDWAPMRRKMDMFVEDDEHN
ncbi:MAG: hypothetical protein M1825_003841 [Sarcosagium campestre]|nr:MAG: hypothetical protein M1825_003841 [Sarcosagium campestre]